MDQRASLITPDGHHGHFADPAADIRDVAWARLFPLGPDGAVQGNGAA